nr:hypothetical protein [Tanacetum cinerariifolium]
MQEFWATATVHHNSIRFKMDNRKRIVNLEYFREMLHICLRLPAIINKCLSGKSTGYDSLRLSQAQILWGLYHKKNVDFAYILWEDFVYQVEHKDVKKSNEMYYLRDDQMFNTIKLVSRHQNTQQFGVLLPIKLTNKDIRNSEAYKEYYAVALGAAPPKTKASVMKTKSSFDTSITPPTAAGTRLDEDDDDDVDERSDDQDDDDDQDIDEEGEEFIHPKLSIHDEEETKVEESFNPIPKTPKNSDDEGNDDENLGLNGGSEEGQDAEDNEDELYRDINTNLEGRVVQMADTTSQMDVQALTTVASLILSTPTLTPSTIPTISTIPQAPTPPTTALGNLLYMDQRMNEAVKVAVQIQSDRFRDEAQAENEEFLKNLDENIQKIIKEQTSYAVVADLSEMELKKILIKKIEGNKSIHRSDEQRNLYKALVEAYEFDKIILDTYGDIVTLKRHRDDDADKDEEPSAGSDRGSKSDLAKQADSRSSFNELMDTPVDFSAFIMNRLKVDTLIPKLLVGPTYELMKGSCKSLVELEFFLEEVYKVTTDKHIKWIEDLVPQTMWSQEPISYDMHALWGISHWGRKRQHFYGFAVNRDSARHVYSKRRIIVVTELQIVEWYNYKHLDWIIVRKLTNLTVEECFAFNVSLRKFTRSICFQRRVEDLQLCVESYQKKLNLIKPNTYRSDLKRKEAYTTYSNPRGFIYQNKDKQNRLMRINELHKFSDGTLNDVLTVLDDRLKCIRMKYLPQAIWRKSDKERAEEMIQAIDKQLKMRRIMRSLEKFVGGRMYKGDFRMLQRTI